MTAAGPGTAAPAPHRRRWRRAPVALLTAALLAALLVRAAQTHPGAGPRAGTGAGEGQLRLTSQTGRVVSLAELRGQAVLVWFLAVACSSCEASVPVVAAHLPELSADGVRVLALDLAGDLPAGRRGLARLAAFGRLAAGAAYARPGWTWGLASPGLSHALDPTGLPDVYLLLDRAGRLRFQGTAPVDSMPALLRAAGALAHENASQERSPGLPLTPATPSTLP